MSEKIKIELEYDMNTSPGVIYNRLATPGGLSEWFADDVNLKKDVYFFIWEGQEQAARVLNKKTNKVVRFRWLEDEDENNDYFFEFKLQPDDLTGALALIITDFAEEDEEEEVVDLWDSQISELKRVLGL